MNDTPMPAPLAAVETFATPEAAQGEYRRYMASPEFQAAQSNVGAKGPAMARLEALAKAAWPTPGVQASPAPTTPQDVQRGTEAMADALNRQSAGEPIDDADSQAVADAFAPVSASDYIGALPGEEFAELRQTMFEHGISKSAANLMAAGEGLIEQTLALDDAGYYAKTDMALADVRSLPGGNMLARKAVDMVNAIPADHLYRPFAEYALTLPGGIQELAYWSDRLRAKGRTA